MTKILLYSLVNIVLFIAISETASYGSDKFSKYYNQAIEHYKHGKYDQAGDQFEKALELKPSDAYALYGLGNTYYCKAKYDEAIKIYTKAIGINPDYAKVHYSLSLAYNKMGMTREAEKEKKIFRKISQGGKGSEKAQAHKEKTSRAPVKVSAHTGKEEHGRSEFGLTGTKHAEPADFGRSGYDQKTQEHKKAADTDKHDLSTKHTLVSKGAHTFGSKRGHPDARLKGHSTGSTHAAHETHSSGTKQDHGKAESHGGAEHDTHKAAAHGAEAAHDAGGGAHHDAG
ncbi:MAG: tetratricopeptide repeat protein, partial [Planctomycetes bacterium]|nr:tetratricopeptide repeat protein [Planctomycetota bacterium]